MPRRHYSAAEFFRACAQRKASKKADTPKKQRKTKKTHSDSPQEGLDTDEHVENEGQREEENGEEKYCISGAAGAYQANARKLVCLGQQADASQAGGHDCGDAASQFEGKIYQIT